MAHHYHFPGRTTCLIAVLLFALGNVNAQQSQSLMIDQLISDSVRMSCSDQSNGYWVVAGDSLQRLFHVDAKQKVKKYPSLNRRIANTTVTSMVGLNENLVFLGTHGQYLSCVYNHRSITFDYRHGLTDSVIVAIEIDSITQNILIHGQHKTFLLDYRGDSNQFRFKEVNLSASQNTGATKPFRRKFRKFVYKAICDVFGNVDYSFRNHKSIKTKHVQQIKRTLQPGDILIKRNDYQLSNVGIPGFWTHAAIYLGSLKDIDHTFAGLPLLNGQKASDYIRLNHYHVYQQLRHGRNLIIEAVGEGVTINPLEHIAKVDYFAAIRPGVNREAMFMALNKSFSFYRVPYDYLFDLESNDAMVCSELVYKSFGNDEVGLTFRMSEREGKPFLSPNDIALQCVTDEKAGTPSFKLVVFCGADEKRKKTDFKTFEEFEWSSQSQ
jgi:hypothetical protein